MSQQEQFLADMTHADHHLAVLVAQVGATPNELQLMVEVARLDEAAGGLRRVRNYIIRVLGVLEHRIVNFGTTVNQVALVDDHPLLYEYVERPTAVFFKGAVANPDGITLDIAQAHATTFAHWRRFPEYLNVQQPLQTLFASGGGLIGQMPESLAVQIIKVLEHYGLEHKTAHGTPYIQAHDNPALVQQTPQVLTLGASYFVGYAFAFDEMKGRQKPPMPAPNDEN